MKKTVAIVTSSRADFSHLAWPLRAIEEHPDLEAHLIAFGAHLSPEFGHTVDAIREEGFTVHARSNGRHGR